MCYRSTWKAKKELFLREKANSLEREGFELRLEKGLRSQEKQLRGRPSQGKAKGVTKVSRSALGELSQSATGL